MQNTGGLPISASSYRYFSDHNPIKSKVIDGNLQKPIAVVHLDSHINRLPSFYDDVLGITMIDYCFDDKNKCLKLINQDYQDGIIFFLCSGGLAAELIPSIHALPQLYAVYILCGDIDRHKIWALKYEKVRVVGFDERKERFPAFSIDFAKLHEQFGDARVALGENHAGIKRYKKVQKILEFLKLETTDWSKRIDEKIQNLPVNVTWASTRSTFLSMTRPDECWTYSVRTNRQIRFLELKFQKQQHELVDF